MSKLQVNHVQWVLCLFCIHSPLSLFLPPFLQFANLFCVSMWKTLCNDTKQFPLAAIVSQMSHRSRVFFVCLGAREIREQFVP